jgi:hypothetical protein
MLMIVQEKEEKIGMNDRNRGRVAWTNNDELVFVEHLRKKTRMSLLEGYLAGLARRVNWGDINPQEVRIAALSAIERLK